MSSKPVQTPSGEGMEKRAVVAYGWTPAEGSPVREKVLLGCRKTAAGRPTDVELDNDTTKRLAEGLEAAG